MPLIYITCKDKKEAFSISKTLLKEKLIACANFFSVKSIYLDKKRIVSAKEEVILAKTKTSKLKKAIDKIKAIHSYKIPCILTIKVKTNKEYQFWLNKAI